MPLIREETTGEYEAIRAVNRLAFGGDGEAALVERLRADGLAVASLVAVEGGEVAGHILFRARGKAVVIVLGRPGYYPRFGFSTQMASRIACPFPGAGDAWMALELTPGALSGVTATVRYPAAFGLVEP